ncbi:hypothetical protein MNB_SUP05-5-1140 [hydrothermal vent metagenome]|uniref:Uncharacterized protein n=1 Tax=hydrothermal vent metagenome TaxID=652676 RepID=A0A1W1CVU1_9ZZZZ
MSLIQKQEDSFWNTDLEDIEKTFLASGQKITDLPTTLDNRVPPQGSSLLDRIANLDTYSK